MINSHKELVTEIEDFCIKFDLINDFKYIKDVDKLIEESLDSEPRVFLMGLKSLRLDDENYNAVLSYSFVIADQVIYDDKLIINSETDNIFTVSALGDYLKHITDVPIDFGDIDFMVESDRDSTFTSVTGTFDFIVKRNPSYWKKMEAYNQG